MNADDMILISVDDHVIEPPTMFDGHVPRELLGKMPQYVTGKDGHAFGPCAASRPARRAVSTEVAGSRATP